MGDSSDSCSEALVGVSGVTLICLDRPSRRNAVNREAAEALVRAFRAFEADETARVAVLYGKGGTFCAGADLAAFDNLLSEDGDESPMGPARMHLSKPVIAAITGHAVAGGLELACLCDLRVAEEDATLGVFCRRHGVPLIDGGTVRLPRLIGMSRALDLILTGRPVSAREALDMGLVNRVCGRGRALDVAVAMAETIANYPQACMRADRASVYAQVGRPIDDALRFEFRNALPTLQAAAEGAHTFMSRRYRFVFFDLGGVVLTSPIRDIEAFTQRRGLPRYSINRALQASPDWAALECGQLTLVQFMERFDDAYARKHGFTTRELFDEAMRVRVRPKVASAIRRLRAQGVRVAAVTNNWLLGGDADSNTTSLLADLDLFDTVVESCREGVRKPSPSIYEIAIKRLKADPRRSVFVDDMGRNLRYPRERGMATVKVSMDDADGSVFLEELARLMALTTPPKSNL